MEKGANYKREAGLTAVFDAYVSHCRQSARASPSRHRTEMESSTEPTSAATPPGGSHSSPPTPAAGQDYLAEVAAAAAAAGAAGQMTGAGDMPYFNLSMPSMQTLYPVSFPGAMPPTAAGMPLMQVRAAVDLVLCGVDYCVDTIVS